MIFPFGIKKEAEIYCNSAKFALTRQVKEIEPQIASIANNMINNGTINLPYEIILEDMVRWVESAVKDSGWDLRDEDGASWWIGILATSYLRAKGGYNHSFEDIFQKVFIKYFQNK